MHILSTNSAKNHRAILARPAPSAAHEGGGRWDVAPDQKQTWQQPQELFGNSNENNSSIVVMITNSIYNIL